MKVIPQEDGTIQRNSKVHLAPWPYRKDVVHPLWFLTFTTILQKKGTSPFYWNKRLFRSQVMSPKQIADKWQAGFAPRPSQRKVSHVLGLTPHGRSVSDWGVEVSQSEEATWRTNFICFVVFIYSQTCSQAVLTINCVLSNWWSMSTVLLSI